MEKLEQIADLLKSAKKTYEEMQQQNQTLKQNIDKIFQEEEIKKCPSYALFKATYSVDSLKTYKEIKKVNHEIINPYGPRSSRKKPSLNIHKKSASATAKSKFKPEISNDECLIPSQPKQKKPSPTTIVKTPPESQTEIEVQQVELNKDTYLFVNNKFYSSKTGDLVGQIDNGVIMLNKQPITLKTRKVKKYDDQHYVDADSRVYLKCNSNVARAVGDIVVDNNEEFVGYFS